MVILSWKLLRWITSPIQQVAPSRGNIFFISKWRKVQKIFHIFRSPLKANCVCVCVCAERGGKKKREGKKRGKHSTRWHNNFSNWIRAAWRNSRNPLKRRIWNSASSRNKTWKGGEEGGEKRWFRSRILNLFCRRWGATSRFNRGAGKRFLKESKNGLLILAFQKPPAYKRAPVAVL